jgi:ABC-2 type transport system permease protein
MIAIMKRELRMYFQTPIGYVFMGLFLLLSAFFFAMGNMRNGSSYYASFLGTILFLHIFSVPLLTMRLLSEERKQRTDQLLLTSPITVTGIVIGKFLAAFCVFVITLAVTILYAVVVAVFGDLAFWETVGGYIGFALIGASFISIGVAVSAISENQVSAAFFTFFSLLLIWFLDLIKGVAPADVLSGTIFAAALGIGVALFFFFNTRNWIVTGVVALLAGGAIGVIHLIDGSLFEDLISEVLGWISLLDRFDSFTLGIVKLADVVFYLSFTAVFLFIATRLIEKRRWA